MLSSRIYYGIRKWDSGTFLHMCPQKLLEIECRDRHRTLASQNRHRRISEVESEEEV